MMKTLSTSMLLGTALLLGGCAGLRSITSDVNSYGEWPAGRQAGTYAFDRLPSQQAHMAESERVEISARSALQKAGFTPAPAGQEPAVLVQVGARDVRYNVQTWDDPLWWRGSFGYWRSGPWGGPRWGLGGRYGYGGYGSYAGFGPGWGYYDYARPYHEREVALLIRDRASGKPLFEARANSDGTRGLDGTTLTAMFDAALADFPRQGTNPRRVTVELPKPPPQP